jgi:hypothetical protein
LSFYQGHDCQTKTSPLRFTLKSSTDIDTCNDESIVEVECSTNICDVNERRPPPKKKTSFAPLELQKGTGTSDPPIPLTSDLNTLRGRKHSYRKKNKQKRKEKCKKQNKKIEERIAEEVGTKLK